ncbi:MAG: prolyl oligopeptidase family serine peptidase [Pseudomonadota bacterium]
MTELTGPTRPPAAGGAPQSLVVFLHGYGADGADLMGLADALAPALPQTAFASPHAPLGMAMGGRAWFELTMRDPTEYARGVLAAAPVLQAYLDHELGRLSLPGTALGIVGFSQGTMMALHVAYRRAAAPACVVGFSGLCADADEEALKPSPTLLIHGVADEVVPAAQTLAAAQVLANKGVPVEWHMVPGLGHGIDPTGLTMAADHLRRHLAR